MRIILFSLLTLFVSISTVTASEDPIRLIKDLNKNESITLYFNSYGCNFPAEETLTILKNEEGNYVLRLESAHYNQTEEKELSRKELKFLQEFEEWQFSTKERVGSAFPTTMLVQDLATVKGYLAYEQQNFKLNLEAYAWLIEKVFN